MFRNRDLVCGRRAPQPKRRTKGTRAYVNAFNEISDLRGEVQRRCAADATQKWDDQFGKLQAAIDKLAESDEKEVVKEYFEDLHKWQLERQKGVPGIGTWDEARAKIDAMQPLLDTKLPGVEDMAGLMSKAAELRSAKADLSKIGGYISNKLMNCDGMIAPKLRFETNRRLTDLVEEANKKIFDLKNELMRTKLSPFMNVGRRVDEAKDLSTWEGHGKWVRYALETVARAEEIVQMETLLSQVQDYTESDDKDGPGNALEAAKQRIATLSPLLTKRLAEVGYPKAAARDPVRDKALKSFLEKDDAIVYGPTYLPGTAKQTFDETDTKDHLRHRVERLVGNGYVVVRPATWPHLAPKSIPANELCEIQWFNFFKYTAAGPSHTKNSWLVNMENNGRSARYQTPILCKNAKVITKLK